MEHVEAGVGNRAGEEPLRLGNFRAWHLREDREASRREARRELIWRRSLAAPYADDLRAFCHDEDEVGLVLANSMSFLAAFRSGSGHSDGVLAFRETGLTELALRLGDDPLEALTLIGRHVLPALR